MDTWGWYFDELINEFRTGGHILTQCRNGCGKELTWDKTRKSDGGKMIPIEKATNEPHQCPKSAYNMARSGGTTTTAQVQQTITGESTQLTLAERIGILEAAIASIQAKLNQLSP